MPNSRRPSSGLSAKACLIFLLTLGLAMTAVPTFAERGEDTERMSKNGKVEGTLHGVAVTIEYGRPKAKGREIWGALVPYGKVWRTGADEATTITFDKSVSVAGAPVDAGTYALFTIPGEATWTVVLNKVAEQWGSYNHDPEQDVAQGEVRPRASEEHVEELTFTLEDGAVVLHWAKLQVPIEIRAAE